MNTRTNDKGYIEENIPGHPLDPGGKRGGWVLQHRRVLFELLGSDDQPCYWCGWPLPWRDAGFKTCINVDHLNEDRTDNRPQNLVPSCWWCNANRSWSRTAPTMWAEARRRFGQMAPNDRPATILWLAEEAEKLKRQQRNTGRAVLGSAAIRPAEVA